MSTHNISEKIYSHATRLVAPFSSDSGAAWAAVPTGPLTHEAWPLASTQFRKWLAYSFFAEHEIFPGRNALNNAICLLQGRAHFDLKRTTQEAFTRIGCHGEPHRAQALTIDLANAAREAVEITTQGWRVTSGEGHRFRRIAAMRPLPRPAANSDSAPLTAQLRSLFALSKSDLNRIAVWLFSALRPMAPYPILILTGPPASGKTTTARVLRNLLDPSATPLYSAPATERDLFRHALHNRVLLYDHVPALNSAMAAAVSRVAAGTAFTESSNHAYDEPLRLSIERPIIVTVPYSDTNAANWNRYRTIQNLAMTIHLDAISAERRQSQDAIMQRAEESMPAILATLCNAASAALDSVADLQQWITAAAPILGIREAEAIAALNPSPLISALLNLLAEEQQWSGTATALLARIDYEGAATARLLSEQLARAPLALYGINCQSTRSTRERTIRLSMTQTNFPASFSASSCVMD